MLEFVDTRNNDIGDAGAQAIAKALASTNKYVTEINLAQNDIDHEGVIALAGMLRKNKTLETLDLSSNFWVSRTPRCTFCLLCNALTH